MTRKNARRSIVDVRATAGRVEALSVTATEAKNEFGRLLESAIQGRRVVITKHETPSAVLISKADFDALSSGEGQLVTLSEEFDAVLAKMQTPKARAGMKAAFDASPSDLRRAAVAAARRRG